jgi:uncharacterized protein
MITVKLELDEQKQGAFNLYEDDKKAGEMVVNVDSVDITVYHTEVLPEYEGKGYAKLLLDALVAEARKTDKKIIPLCPYVHAQFKRHPQEYEDVWEK